MTMLTTRPQFTVFICVLFILPTAHPTTALNMNYSIVAIGAVFVLVGACWAFWGRFRFRGPVKTALAAAASSDGEPLRQRRPLAQARRCRRTT